ncbi:MAG: MATE family efflux transporter [Paracoccaceae bacterium]
MRSPLSNKQHAIAVLSLGLPLIGSHLAQFAVQMADTIMLGWYGVAELAAMVLGGMFFFVLFIVGSGFAWAVMPVVAAAAASGNHMQVRRTTRMAMWLSVLFGLLAMPLFFFAERLLLLSGQQASLAAMAGDYLRIAGFGLIPALLVMVLKSYLAALERTQIVLWVTAVAAVLNGLVNYALIFGNWGAPELGIVGAAIGSVILQLLTVFAMIGYTAYATPEHALFRRLWRPEWEAFGHIFALGWPIGLTGLAEVGLFSASAIMMGWIGAVELAAHGIAIQLASLAFLVHLGISNVATIRAGQAFGRRDEAELRRGALVGIALSLGFAAITVALFVSIPQTLLGLFVDPDDAARPAVLAAGVGLLYVAALFQLADAGQVMALGLLRGVQDTRAPMIYAAISYWLIGIPLSYYFGFTLNLGGVGIWLGLVVGLSLAWVLMATRFWRGAVRIGQSVSR